MRSLNFKDKGIHERRNIVKVEEKALLIFPLINDDIRTIQAFKEKYIFEMNSLWNKL